MPQSLKKQKNNTPERKTTDFRTKKDKQEKIYITGRPKGQSRSKKLPKLCEKPINVHMQHQEEKRRELHM